MSGTFLKSVLARWPTQNFLCLNEQTLDALQIGPDEELCPRCCAFHGRAIYYANKKNWRKRFSFEKLTAEAIIRLEKELNQYSMTVTDVARLSHRDRALAPQCHPQSRAG
jgi:hypothetical protein